MSKEAQRLARMSRTRITDVLVAHQSGDWGNLPPAMEDRNFAQVSRTEVPIITAVPVAHNGVRYTFLVETNPSRTETVVRVAVPSDQS